MVFQVHSREEYDTVLTEAPVVFVDFFAVWCGPCRAVAPIIEQWETESIAQKQQIKYVKVDVDELPELAQRMEISAMPTFLIYKSGVLKNRIVGANVPALQKAIDTLLSDVPAPAPEHEEVTVVDTTDVAPDAPKPETAA